MTARRRTDGYTLVEALASLTLLGLVSFMLVVGLQSARLRLARLDRATQATGVEAAQTMLRARIERAVPVTVLQSPEAIVDFDGRNDELRFSAPAPQAHGPDGVYRYRLYLAGNGDLRLDAANDLVLDQTRPASEVVLLRDVASLDIAYFGPAGPSGPTWLSHWQQQATLPRLVRIRIAFAAGDRRRWPSLIVRPAATIDSDCVVDPNSGGCQGRA